MKIEKLNNFSENIFIVSVFVSPHESSHRAKVFRLLQFFFSRAVKKFTQKLKQKQRPPVSEKDNWEENPRRKTQDVAWASFIVGVELRHYPKIYFALDLLTYEKNEVLNENREIFQAIIKCNLILKSVTWFWNL